MERIITKVLCITKHNEIPRELTKIIIKKLLSPSYHKLLHYYDDEFIIELSIEFIEQIRILSNFKEDHISNYCVLLKNTDLLLPVINYRNYENYIQTVNTLEKLQDQFNINFQLYNN